MYEQEEMAAKKLGKKKKKKSATLMQFETKEMPAILCADELETVISRKNGTTKTQSKVKQPSPVMYNETEREKVTTKTSKNKKDSTEIKEASKNTIKKKKGTPEIQSETSPILCAENEQEKKTSKKEKSTAGIKFKIKDASSTLYVETEQEKRKKMNKIGKSV